jgi:flagellar biosynthesis GTPase FlhF
MGDRIVLGAGIALATMVVLDRMVFAPPEERPTRRRGRRGDRRDDERRERAVERAEERLKRLEERIAEARKRADEWERRARAAQGRGATATARKAREVAERAEQEEKRLTRQAESLDSLAQRIERGEVVGAELRELMASGKLRLRNPSDRHLLQRAMRLSEEFHGTPHEVIELAPAEQQVSRYLVALGRLPELRYVPDGHSERGGVEWVHESGDRGFARPRSDRQPWLAVDPATLRPVIVPMRSPMRLNAARGLEG